MRLRTLTLCTALVAATLGTPTLHAAPFTPEQEARIKELIRETLIANPGILDEAAESWEKQNAATQQAQMGDFIKGNQDVLFNSPTSPRLGAKHPKLTLVLFTDGVVDRSEDVLEGLSALRAIAVALRGEPLAGWSRRALEAVSPRSPLRGAATLLAARLAG